MTPLNSAYLPSIARHAATQRVPISHRRPRIAALAGLLACLAISSVTAQNRPAPVALDSQFQPAHAAATLVKVSGPPAFKGVRRVAITQFTAEFATYDAVAATAGFGAGSRQSPGAATQVSRVHLQGIDAASTQRWLDQLLAEFRERLARAGLEILSHSQLIASPVYTRMARGGTALPLQDDARIVAGATGLGLYGYNRGHLGAVKPAGAVGGLVGLSGLANLANVATGLGAVSIIPDSMELQKDLGGDIGLIEVHLRLHFADLQSATSTWSTENKASVGVRATPEIRFAQMSLFSGTTLGTLLIEAPLQLNPAAFAEFKERPKSTGEKAGAALGLALAFAAGSSASTNSTTYDITVDSAQYPQVLAQAFGTVTELWLTRLEPLR